MLKLYNSLTRKKETFKALKKGEVRIYNCGPTVYDFAHLGNLRAFVFVDLLRRYLEYKGYKVKQVMNITDLDDKTIQRSRERYLNLKPKEALRKFTSEYEKYFWQNIDRLNILRPHVSPHATEYLREMQELIRCILKAGYAYEKEGSIYFDVKKYARDYKYGQLVKIDPKKLKTKKTIEADEYDKESIQDFALWKKAKRNEPGWDFKLKMQNLPSLLGRPGWHIECSAMGKAELGFPFDIHTGGVDLKFPHHENEIAQDIAAFGLKRPVRFWLHNEHLLVEGEKMAKSKGNYYTLRDLLARGYSSQVIRYLLLATRYRQKLNFTFQGLRAAQGAIERLDEFVEGIPKCGLRRTEKKNINNLIKQTKQQFEKALDDDLNISKALGVVFDFIRKMNTLSKTKGVQALACQAKPELAPQDQYTLKSELPESRRIIQSLLFQFDQVLGLNLGRKKTSPLSPTFKKKINQLIAEREQARQQKNWSQADQIRKKLEEMGVELRDTPKGPKWRYFETKV